MKINLITFVSILLLSLSVITQPSAAFPDSFFKPILMVNQHSVLNKFSVHGIQTHYWLDNRQGEIPMTITTLENLLITAYLYDQDDNEKVQVATLIDNHSKEMILVLDDLSIGNYRLVVTSLNTNHQRAEKTFYITLSNLMSNYNDD
ncbi:TPA: DUF4469 domain-containing protein [Yersinia enterocolitica]|nr:DUF4469 domain-containing protein [Yersinia enterocolitica]HDL7824212.1 DUF4469 domain-containing protein [Yersinia enterocolitica]HDL7831995.1 DUF4469 domain-containing protein [Yersinia enterocolitica]HDL7872659.1 DUF4469 domain-containing protein [Yersinia enterocolitica]HDL7885502.1 DUF4469 domain-containing protein [Yersinia enterocolitica]